MKQSIKIITSYLIVVLVALMMAVNYQLFVFPNRFAPAGLNGIFTMIQHLFGFKFSYTTILTNIPLAIAAFFINSKPRALRSLVYCLSFSGFLMLLDHVDLSPFVYSTTISTLMGPLVAGLITGFGGYVMHNLNACYGGTEFIAGFIHRFKPGVNFFNVIFLLNITVALASYFVYDYNIEPVLMCIIYSYGSSSVRDTLNRKSQQAVRCEIITAYPDQIRERIISQLRHTATEITGKGAYSEEPKSILLCIVNPSQINELTKLVADYPESFVIVSSVTRIMGNFKHLDSRGKPEVKMFDQGKHKV